MKKLLILITLICSFAFAKSAQVVDIVSENIIKVKESSGVVKNIHLSGIELFATVNNSNKNVSYKIRDILKEKTISYMKTKIKIGSNINYFVVAKDSYGVEKVWIDNYELNYLMVKEGYAIVNMKDKFLPTVFKNRMSIAMNYAKEKKLGLWKDSSVSMLALVNKDIHMCGWKNSKINLGLTKNEVLEELKAHLPTSYQKEELFILASSK
ncbi:thermonuclease family protein [Halarcobacter ebronensis]|nr:thermonuclease family protein [Halarcobacter ebronensis]QKF82227.1 SNc domain-containing protein [Halarcobacter ebronensis]